MQGKLRRPNELCAQYRAALEDLPAGTVERETATELGKRLPAATTAHAEECTSCKAATQTFWASRNLLAELQGGLAPEVEAVGKDAAPWFATRVMAKIAEREMEVQRAKMEWSGAVTKWASRLAWISGLMLLVGSTWLYDGRSNVGPSNTGRPSASAGQSSTEAGSPYLFDNSAAPSNGDDALVSLAER